MDEVMEKLYKWAEAQPPNRLALISELKQEISKKVTWTLVLRLAAEYPNLIRFRKIYGRRGAIVNPTIVIETTDETWEYEILKRKVRKDKHLLKKCKNIDHKSRN